MGAVWERFMRSVRNILVSAAIGTDCHSRRTCDADGRGMEAILNPRPLTAVTFDHKDDEPLNPNHLCFKLVPRLQALGVFGKDDCYARGRWRQIQWMADQFWRR